MNVTEMSTEVKHSHVVQTKTKVLGGTVEPFGISQEN